MCPEDVSIVIPEETTPIRGFLLCVTHILCVTHLSLVCSPIAALCDACVVCACITLSFGIPTWSQAR